MIKFKGCDERFQMVLRDIFPEIKNKRTIDALEKSFHLAWGFSRNKALTDVSTDLIDRKLITGLQGFYLVQDKDGYE